MCGMPCKIRYCPRISVDGDPRSRRRLFSARLPKQALYGISGPDNFSTIPDFDAEAGFDCNSVSLSQGPTPTRKMTSPSGILSLSTFQMTLQMESLGTAQRLPILCICLGKHHKATTGSFRPACCHPGRRNGCGQQ
jgi:hypothetical protein